MIAVTIYTKTVITQENYRSDVLSTIKPFPATGDCEHSDFCGVGTGFEMKVDQSRPPYLQTQGFYSGKKAVDAKQLRISSDKCRCC